MVQRSFSDASKDDDAGISSRTSSGKVSGTGGHSDHFGPAQTLTSQSLSPQSSTSPAPNNGQKKGGQPKSKTETCPPQSPDLPTRALSNSQPSQFAAASRPRTNTTQSTPAWQPTKRADATVSRNSGVTANAAPGYTDSASSKIHSNTHSPKSGLGSSLSSSNTHVSETMNRKPSTAVVGGVAKEMLPLDQRVTAEGLAAHASSNKLLGVDQSGSSSSGQSAISGLLPSDQAAAQVALGSAAPTSTSLRANSLGAFPMSSTSMNSNTNGLPSQSHLMTHSSAPFPFRQPFHQHYAYQQAQQHVSMERFTAELTNCVIAFLSPILPTEEEYRIKEATRRQLERLTGKVSPGAKLLAFGSMANGFALKNSDMDLCCLIASDDAKADHGAPKEPLNASALVEALSKILREETDYTLLPLPKARIPIIKISRPPTPELPYDIACDIGFENRLALENTRLLLSYAMVDPPRLRTLVLFLKVWTKRRKLNSPFTGTLSSYGYTLMMIFFLMHVKRPAVLPNLQRIPPSSTTKRQDASLNGHNVYFYDDVATLRKEWSSQNTENVGELLLDFFRYFSKEFGYSRDVISIRSEAGVFLKDGKVWSSELCIEDPFQSNYNVARTVTRDGLYTIRGEFIRASRILTTRMNRVSAALAELCEEREDGLTRAPDHASYQRQRFGNHVNSPHSNLYLATGGFDPRYLRDLTRRIEATSHSPGGFGGSFAFEEMARGLAQAQQGGQAVAYPPTAAMLAPLSQNVGLSSQQSLMRAGLRYEATQRGQSIAAGMPSAYIGASSSSSSGHSGSSANGVQGHSLSNKLSGNTSVPSTPRISSSARSVDGGASSYGRRKSKRWNANADALADLTANSTATSIGTSSGNISAQTSPRLDSAKPKELLHPDAAINGAAYGIGEAFAYGSEISFGSQRFQLYPQQTSKRPGEPQGESGSINQRQQLSSSNLLSPASAAFHSTDGSSVLQKENRSFSDGLSRSKSLPRQVTNSERRSSTPALSDPASPSALVTDGQAEQTEMQPEGRSRTGEQVEALVQQSFSGDKQSTLASVEKAEEPQKPKRFSSMSQTTGRPGDSINASPRLLQSRASFSHDVSLASQYPTSVPHHHHHLPSQSANGSPYLTASPWSFFAPSDGSVSRVSVPSGEARLYAGSIATADEESSFALLDDDDEESGERISMSDGTMDELARESAVGSSMGGGVLDDRSSECEDGGVESEGSSREGEKGDSSGKRRTVTLVKGDAPRSPRTDEVRTMADHGKEHDVRSWAASQREELNRRRNEE